RDFPLRDVESLAAASGSANPQRKRREPKTDPDALASAETITLNGRILPGGRTRSNFWTLRDERSPLRRCPGSRSRLRSLWGEIHDEACLAAFLSNACRFADWDERNPGQQVVTEQCDRLSEG